MQNTEKRIAELEKQANVQSIEFQLNAPWLDIKNLILRNSFATAIDTTSHGGSQETGALAVCWLSGSAGECQCDTTASNV